MLTLGGTILPVYLAVGETDLRKGSDGLQGLVRSQLEANPASGALFVFCNADRNRLKVLVFDGSGFWVCTKRLGKGRFDWPRVAQVSQKKRLELTPTEFSALVDGLRLTEIQIKPWWRLKMTPPVNSS